MKENKLVLNAFKRTCMEKYLSFIILVVSIILGIIMQLIPPQILKSIIDEHISKGVSDGLWKLAFLYLISIMISGVSDFIREFTMATIGQNTLANIRYSMAKKISKLPISYFSNNSVGAIMSYFTSDVDSVGTLLTSGVIGMIADVLKIIGIVVSIYLLSPTLVVYVIIVIPIIYLITKKFKRATLKAQIEARKAVSKINGYIQETFSQMRTIKIFNKEKHFIDMFQGPLNDNINAVHKTSTFDSVFPCLMQILRAIIITIVVLVSVQSGLGVMSISIGSIAACVELISRMLSPIESVATEFQTLQEAISGLRRIHEFETLEEENRMEESSKFFKLEEIKNFDINVKSISFKYESGNEVVKDVSFNVKPGTKVALIGRTGAGKTTIMNLIAGLYKPILGNIKIGGIDPFTMPPNIRRKIIGIVPQNFNIYDGTIRDAITLYDEEITDEEVIGAAKIVGLHDEIVKLERGYDTIIGEGETKLSNGEYQLLYIACAIVCNPKVLLLDEVTSGLDSVTEKRIFKVLREISKNRTLLTISHRISGIIDADEVIILQNGRVVEMGTPQELVGKNGWYAKYNQMEELGWKIN